MRPPTGYRPSFAARVVGVADAFDAMTSDRPYRAGMPAARAFAELTAGAGTHFDPECVAAFVRIRPRLEAMLEKDAAERRATQESETMGAGNTISRQELDRERKAAQAAAASHSGILNSMPSTKEHRAFRPPA